MCCMVAPTGAERELSMNYVVTGRFQAGRGENQFTREVDAESENHAEDLVLSSLTSEHSISRANIEVEDVSEAED